jgi:pimeloyl-ACP methyl ester carboxylesterase
VIAWELCPLPEAPARECGELAVPLDYDEPAGATIDLAVARIPATGRDGRIGSLVLNPGGPGGPGVVGLAIQYPWLPEAVRERFDIVGFDPRGIGESATVRCFDSVAERVEFLYFADLPRVPVGPEQEAAWERAARSWPNGAASATPKPSTTSRRRTWRATWTACERRSATRR